MARRRIWSVGSGPYWLRVVVSVGPAHSPTSGWLRPVESEREDLDTSHRLHLFLCRWDLTCICVPVQVYKNHTSVVPDSVFFFFLNSGSGSEIQFLSEAQDDPQKRKPDIKKAKLMLGWEPEVPLEEGLNKAIFYFQNSNTMQITRTSPNQRQQG